MENILLNLANNELEEKETFKVDNDVKADWCLDKIREENAEIKRFEMVMDAKIDNMKEAFETFKNSKNQSVEFFQSKLNEYFETLTIKPTKAGNKSYKLPSGSLKLKKQQPEFVRENEVLLTFLKENKYDDFVKTTESADWASLKKDIDILDDKILIDGQEVEGVKVVERPDKFEVSV